MVCISPISRGHLKQLSNKKKLIQNPLKPQTKECADAPFAVVHGEALLIPDVGEVEHHRHANEFIAPLPDDGAATGNDDLREVVVQGDVGIAERHRGVTVDNERGEGGDMQQPTLMWYVIVAVASAKANVCHLQLHRLLPIERSVLTLT